MQIDSSEDVDHWVEVIRKSSSDAQAWMVSQSGDGLDMLRRMKFDAVGLHPVDRHALNMVEQINQTWTFLVALAAARQLLLLHPEAGGFRLAPGAHAQLPLDIVSVKCGLVGAETFAAVHPRNNRKLERDLSRMAGRNDRHRYVFFLSPKYPGNCRLMEFERDGVEVWSVDV